MSSIEFENWITKNLTQFSSSTITKLANGIFYGQKKLTSVNIPNVTILPRYSFYNCSNLSTLLTGTLIRLEDNCLCFCPISTLDVSNVTYVGQGVFNDNRNLTSLDFASLETLSYAGLWGVYVSKVWLPSTCVINGRNFYQHYSPLTIYTDAPEKPDSWDSEWNYSNSDVVWGATHTDFENA